MDHTEATRLQAAERYVLGELPQALREEYEEHFFDCPACALDIKAAAAFTDTTREVLREQPQRDRFRVKAAAPVSGGWFSWLKPAFAMPAFAALALLLVVGYQNIVTIPSVKEQASRGSVQVVENDFRVQGATRGENLADITIAPKTSFAVVFDFIPSRSSSQYVGQLVDEHGNLLSPFKLSGEKINKEVRLVIAGGVTHPGRYTLILAADPNATGEMRSENEAQRLQFNVVFPK